MCKRLLAFSVVLIVTVGLLGPWAPIAMASRLGADFAEEAPRIKVIKLSHEVHFAEKVVFFLSAESDAPIVRLTLFRQLSGEPVRVRVEVKFEPGKKADAQYTWELEPGDLKPGLEVTYFWQIEDAAGNRHQTEPITFTYVDSRFDWKMLSQGQINVYYYDNPARAQEILAAALDAAQRLQKDVGITIEKAISIYVYESEADMRDALMPRSETYDARTVTLGVAEGQDTLLLLGSHRDALLTVAHEMSHLILHLAADNPYSELPRWLDEGLAMYAEGKISPSHERALQRAIREDRLISVRSLSGYVGDPDQVDLYYAEVRSLIGFMLDTYGREKLAALIEVLKTGVLADEALRQVYGFGLDELDDAWRIHLGLRPRGEMTATPQATGTRWTAPVCAGPLSWIGAVVLSTALIVSVGNHHARATRSRNDRPRPSS